MPETERRASATLTPGQRLSFRDADAARRPVLTMAKELAVFFALAWVAIFVATFATLGGGKIGAGIIEALCIATIYAGIHAGMQHEYPENGGTCEVNPMWPRNPLGRNWCLAWFAYFVIRATLVSTRELARESRCAGEQWSFAVPAEFVLSLMHMTYIAVLLFQAHRERGHFFWWYLIIYFAIALREFTYSSPYPIIGTLGTLMYISTISIGTAVISLSLDSGKDRTTIKNSNAMCTSISNVGLLYFALSVAGANIDTLVKSAVLTAFAPMVFQVMWAILERTFGESNDTKPWCFIAPGLILAIDMGQSMLFLETGFDVAKLVPLILMQEVNSILRNLGLYAKWWQQFMAKIGKPYSEEKIERQARRLAVLSPCDGLVECVTPLIVIMVLVAEALYNALFEVSPSFDNIGVLKIWRYGNSTLELVQLLLLVCVIRVVFICFEAYLHQIAHDREHPTQVHPEAKTEATKTEAWADDSEKDAPSKPEAELPAKERRNPMLEEGLAIYERCASSGHFLLRFAALTSLFCNCVALVPYAAKFGRGLAYAQRLQEIALLDDLALQNITRC